MRSSISVRNFDRSTSLNSSRYQSRVIVFVERSIANNLQPNRDVGVQLHGDLLGRRVSYVAAILNGVNDASSGDVDTGNDKDFAGRIFMQPFRNDPRSPLQGLGLGVGRAITTGTCGGANPTSEMPAGSVTDGAS